jgi:hypothetical protein
VPPPNSAARSPARLQYMSIQTRPHHSPSKIQIKNRTYLTILAAKTRKNASKLFIAFRYFLSEN